MTLLADLPASPAFDRWVLEQPLPVAAVCGVLGIAVGLMLARRGEHRRGMVAGIVLVLAGAAVLAAGALVETTRERLSATTAELVRCAFAADAERAETLIADSLVVASAGDAFESLSKDDLVGAIRGFEAFGTEEWSHRPRGASIDGEGIGRTQSTIRVKAVYLGNQTMPSTWEFTWKRQPDGRWLLTRLECVSMWGQPPRIDWERDVRVLAGMKGRRPRTGLSRDAH